MNGPTMGCHIETCTEDTWPDEDWLIFDTSVGAYEILLCDEHYAAFERGELDELNRPLSAVAAVELVLNNPVKHGAA